MASNEDKNREVAVSISDGIGKITLNRPPLNILNISFINAINSALKRYEVQNECRVVVIEALGKAFCAGVDVADHTPEKTPEMIGAFHSLIRAVWDTPVPTVAVVQGAALGGGAELACACDIVVAAENAKFGVPEIQLGVFPPVAIAEWIGAIGARKTAELALTGRVILAPEALNSGLINFVYRGGTLEEEAKELVLRIAKLSRSALLQTKAALREAIGGWDKRKALDATEARYLKDLMATQDAKEGIAAFMDKREPVWKHR